MPNQNAATVLGYSAQYMAALDRQDTAAMNRLIRAYNESYKRIEVDLNRLIIALGDKTPSRGQLVRMSQYQSMLEQITRELRDLEGLTRVITGEVATNAIGLGNANAARLIAATLTGETEIYARFMKIPNAAIRQMLGFLDPTGPLFAAIAKMSPYYVTAISDALIDGIIRGIGPRQTAALLVRDFGMVLTDALRTVRTAQIWSYREASRANYNANADVVQGWVWFAELDRDVCMSCAAMHGTVHPLSEPLEDHYNGRCDALPLTPLGNPVTQSGEDWFSQLPESQQRAMMGPGKFSAWKDGKFDFGALSTTRQDSTYGQMRTETPLKELIPDE